MAFGVARRGYFKGDLFIAASVVGCGLMLALFIVFPVFKTLSSAFLTEDGHWSLIALLERMASERNLGPGCLAGGHALRRGLEYSVFRAADSHQHGVLGT